MQQLGSDISFIIECQCQLRKIIAIDSSEKKIAILVIFHDDGSKIRDAGIIIDFGIIVYLDVKRRREIVKRHKLVNIEIRIAWYLDNLDIELYNSWNNKFCAINRTKIDDIEWWFHIWSSWVLFDANIARNVNCIRFEAEKQ